MSIPFYNCFPSYADKKLNTNILPACPSDSITIGSGSGSITIGSGMGSGGIVSGIGSGMGSIKPIANVNDVSKSLSSLLSNPSIIAITYTFPQSVQTALNSLKASNNIKYFFNLDDLTKLISQNDYYLKTIGEQIDPILEDYKNAYINSQLNPENSEYLNIFSSNSNNIDSINKSLVNIINSIQGNTNNLGDFINQLSMDIDNLKIPQGYLISKLQQFDATKRGSKIMNINSKQLYKKQYYLNWSMIVGIHLIIFLLYYITRKPNANIQMPTANIMAKPV